LGDLSRRLQSQPLLLSLAKRKAPAPSTKI
jgi:hypothetical protein